MMKISRKELREMLAEAGDRGMAYHAASYIPGFEEAKEKLVALAREVLPVRFGAGKTDYTELVHKETTDALRSVELVLAALKELTVEYVDHGGMVGPLKPRSESRKAEE